MVSLRPQFELSSHLLLGGVLCGLRFVELI
jgi:hypothetical protein